MYGTGLESVQDIAPTAPTSVEHCGVDEDILWGITLKTAARIPRFTTEWMVGKLRLPTLVVNGLLDRLRREQYVEVLGQAGPFNHFFGITDRGRDQARRQVESSAYVGPAPVALSDYTESLTYQFLQLPQVEAAAVEEALAALVLDPQIVELAGLAARARRSLFLFGPSGNGKTTLGHLLHDAVPGSLWIPYALAVDGGFIRVFDAECHQPVEESMVTGDHHDRRWIRIKRPFLVVGGELTTSSLELAFSAAHGCYEAPLHFKANGGTFLLDDFGCQRSSPTDLLNRWIHPLERQVDFLTLQSGQQIQVPFQQMLIISTNLRPQDVMTPAFLRRMGYRIELGGPNAEQFAEIFRRYAAECRLSCDHEVIEELLQRYRHAGRQPAACEPRDLIERTRDLCLYRQQPVVLSRENLAVVWHGYFGE